MNHGIQAEFHIVEKIDALTMTMHGYCQLTLPTQFVIASPAEARPELFSIMRYSYTELFYLLSHAELLGYSELLAALKADGKKFRGTGYENEALDVEYWIQDGDEGHVDWRHAGNYRIVFENYRKWQNLRGVTGSQFSYSLAEKVREFNKDPTEV